MEYTTLGRTGMQVSKLCLGTMMLGSWGNTDRDECERIVLSALESGVNFVDTADVYADGETEEIIGRALRGRRDSVVLATKFHNPMGDGVNQRGNSRRWIAEAVEGSLRRLRTEWIDLYQVHRPDPSTDIDETLGALTDLVRQGKVRAIGTSTFPAEQIVEAQWVAQRRMRERFTVEQVAYSILARQAEAAVLPTCTRHGIGVMVWSPLNGGWLTGKYRSGADAPADSRALRNAEHFDFRTDEVRTRKLGMVEELHDLASGIGSSLLHLGLRFVLSHPAVTSAIMGPRTLEQLLDQLCVDTTVLSHEVLDRIDEIVVPGINVNPADVGWTPAELLDARLRRRV